MPERVIENLLLSQALPTVATPVVSVMFVEIVHDYDVKCAIDCLRARSHALCRRATDTEPFLRMLSTLFEEFDQRVALRKAYKVGAFDWEAG